MTRTRQLGVCVLLAAAQTETWTECLPNDDDTFAVFRPGAA